jgi:hypothetical protein
MDRALDYGSSGWEFDSLRAHFPRPPFFGGRGRVRLITHARERCLLNEADSSLKVLKLCAVVADSNSWDMFESVPSSAA